MDRKFCIDSLYDTNFVDSNVPQHSATTDQLQPVVLNHVIKNLPDGGKYYFPRPGGWIL